MKDAVISLANLVTAFQAQPSDEPLPWNDRAELQELLGLFSARFEGDKQAVLQKVGGAKSEGGRGGGGGWRGWKCFAGQHEARGPGVGWGAQRAVGCVRAVRA
jgi:hypothetical protein